MVLSSGVMQCCMAVQSVQVRADSGPRLLHGHLLFEMAVQMLVATSRFHSGNCSQCFRSTRTWCVIAGGGDVTESDVSSHIQHSSSSQAMRCSTWLRRRTLQCFISLQAIQFLHGSAFGSFHGASCVRCTLCRFLHGVAVDEFIGYVPIAR